MGRIKRKPKTKRSKIKKGHSRAQVLPAALIVGAVLLIFAMAMVSIISNMNKNYVRTSSGTSAVLGADAVVDKAINALTQGNNWGAQPGLSFTPITGYKGDHVYLDMPNAQYIVQINPGNLSSAPGDQAQPLNLSSPGGDKAYERTITVEIYQMPAGNYTPPAVEPTPWYMPGGSAPATWIGHRIVQAVVRRGGVSSSLIADGLIGSGGNFKIYWGDIYDYDQPAGCPYPCTSQTVITTTNPTGPGYPAIHTMNGCIATGGSCAGCFGGSGSTYGTACNVNDPGAAGCKLFPNDPNMPSEQPPDLPSLKTTAQAIYVPGPGQPGAGLSSGESGYFYFTTPIAGANTPGPNSKSVTHVNPPAACGVSVVGQEMNHQYNTANPFGTAGFGGGNQASNVLATMAQNLCLPAPGGATGWNGNDDLVFFVDTTDTQPITNALGSANMVNGSAGSVNFKQFAFRGTFVLQGNYYNNGPVGGQQVWLVPPQPYSNWCPVSFQGQPTINGLLYIGGSVASWTGTPLIYGSIYTKGDATGMSGNGKIYYRGDFNYGLVKSGAAGITRWQEISVFPTPMP